MDKQYILAEIKRVALSNGGRPLGRARFFSETGIRDSDWERYWVRWGDAVREAGLEPNSFQSAYDEGVLMERLISLVREIGRFPVRNELRLKAREDPNFPSEKTFARVGGGLGRQLAPSLICYCQGRTGYEDVLALCSKIRTPSQVVKIENGVNEDGDFGSVYLLRSGRYYKIGRSSAVGRREYELRIQLPDKAKIVHQIRTDDPVGIEEYWHKRFAAKRKNGEWFELSNPDVSLFRRRKFM